LGADYSAGGGYQGICVLRARNRCERRIAFHRRCTVLPSLFWMPRGDARTSRRVAGNGVSQITKSQIETA
jgi:hypothetical protein